MKTALIFGVTGQDGSYLARHLLLQGYRVHGFYRRTSCDSLFRIRDLVKVGCIKLVRGDLTDIESVKVALDTVRPDEVYNFADQDNVAWSYPTAHYSNIVTYRSAVGLLQLCASRGIKAFIPLSATMFAKDATDTEPYNKLNEDSPCNPDSPYSMAKHALHHYCQEAVAKGQYIARAIYFNHDSPIRNRECLLHSLALQIVELKAGLVKTVKVANPSLYVDIGHANEYVKIAHAMMQLEKPEIFVVGTGKPYQISYLLQIMYRTIGFNVPLIVEEGQPTAKLNTKTLIADTTKLLNHPEIGDYARKTIGTNAPIMAEIIARKYLVEYQNRNQTTIFPIYPSYDFTPTVPSLPETKDE